jgi:hypothetical protein
MKRLSLLALAIFAALVAVAYAAAPTATVTDVSDSSVTIGTLKCATNYRFAVRTVNANGTTSAARRPEPEDEGVPDSASAGGLRRRRRTGLERHLPRHSSGDAGRRQRLPGQQSSSSASR